jgi:hypothetical protein
MYFTGLHDILGNITEKRGGRQVGMDLDFT